MIRAVFFSDLHAFNGWPMARPSMDDGAIGTDRLYDATSVIDQVIDHAIEVKALAVFFLGDMFEKRLVDTVTFNAVAYTLKTAAARLEQAMPGAKLYVVAGNHDSSDGRNVSFSTDAYDILGSDNIESIDAETPVMVEDGADEYIFWGIPYAARERWVEMYGNIINRPDFTRGGPDGPLNILLFHNSVIGCTDGGWICDEGITATELSVFDLALAGHFHDNQSFSEPANGFYLGASMPHDFGDDPDGLRGFWTVDFDDCQVDKMYHTAAATSLFLTVNVKVESDDDGKPMRVLRRLMKAGHPIDGNYVRIVWEATAAAYAGIDSAAVTDLLMSKGARGVKHQSNIQYHHRARVDVSKMPTAAEMIESYIVDDGTDTTGLDVKALTSVGLEIISQARRS